VTRRGWNPAQPVHVAAKWTPVRAPRRAPSQPADDNIPQERTDTLYRIGFPPVTATVAPET
jgi:hypothetical protein